MRLVARNVSSGAVIAHEVRLATGRVERAVGLLTRDHLPPGEGLLITPCRGVHTCGMRFPIDLIALDRSGVVVDAVSGMSPWRVRLPRRGAVSVLELPAGTLAQSQTRTGHQISLEPATGDIPR